MNTSQIGPLSKATKIRREHLYRTLRVLEEKGLVERVLGSTTRFTAAPLDEMLPILIKSKQRHISSLKTKTKKIIEKFKKESIIQSASISPEDRFSNFVIISNRQRCLNTVQTYFEGAKTQICLMSNWKKLIQLWQFSGKTLNDALCRGVEVHQITEPPPNESQLEEFILSNSSSFKNPLFEIKYATKIYSNLWMVDSKVLILGTIKKGTNLAERPFLTSTDESLLELVQFSFNTSWETASTKAFCMTRNDQTYKKQRQLAKVSSNYYREPKNSSRPLNTNR